ncbi:MAG: FMN-binding negative transcriptional regulator [Candidatus Obscuribacterales bacterium]|nr:FMN-binding negative transcriptional regulator [Candidatus Obscuribacterales bacterium]
MYLPEAFREIRPEVLQEIIHLNPLGLLVSNCEDGPLASSIPFRLINDGSPHGVLQAHLARANGQCKYLDGQNVLVVFQCADAYISPRWYPSKEEHGKAVPTWNYVMVQARGSARIIDDVSWLKQQVSDLTDQQEQASSKPWKLSDAPASYIDNHLKAIVGVEILLSKLEGKFKLSQNREVKDRIGVWQNLKMEKKDEMADLMQCYGNIDSQ